MEDPDALVGKLQYKLGKKETTDAARCSQPPKKLSLRSALASHQGSSISNNLHDCGPLRHGAWTQLKPDWDNEQPISGASPTRRASWAGGGTTLH
jgi:hypothetical protein